MLRYKAHRQVPKRGLSGGDGELTSPHSIDCAAAYKNEGEVGQGIKAGGVDRDKLFVTSKLWNTEHAPERVGPALDKTLSDLGTDHLDLYLMHWPVAFAQGQTSDGKPKIDWDLTNDVYPTWQAMEQLVESGKVKNIGISNFTIGRAEKLFAQAKIRPAVNQVELNLHCAQPELVAVCLGSIDRNQEERTVPSRLCPRTRLTVPDHPCSVGSEE